MAEFAQRVWGMAVALVSSWRGCVLFALLWVVPAVFYLQVVRDMSAIGTSVGALLALLLAGLLIAALRTIKLQETAHLANSDSAPRVIAAAFADLSKRYGVGQPLTGVQSTLGASLLIHEKATAIWTERYWSVAVIWSDRAQVFDSLQCGPEYQVEGIRRSKSNTPPDKTPPRGSVLKLWERIPSMCDEMGYEVLYMECPGDGVWMQRFTDGLIYGPCVVPQRLHRACFYVLHGGRGEQCTVERVAPPHVSRAEPAL